MSMIRYLPLLILLALPSSCRRGAGEAQSYDIQVDTAPVSAVDSSHANVFVFPQGLRVESAPGQGIRIQVATAKQPVPPKDAATVKIDKESIQSNTGDAAKLDVALSQLGGRSFWFGSILVLVGALLAFSRYGGFLLPGPFAWLSTLARNAPPAMPWVLIGIGAAYICLPWYLEQIPQWLVIAGTVATMGIVGLYFVWHGYTLTQSEPSKSNPSKEVGNGRRETQ